MDPTSAPVNPAELYELLGIIGGVVVAGLGGLLLVRRARAARQRMIEGIDEAPAPRLKDRGRKALDAEPEEAAAPDEEAEAEEAAEAEPEPAPPARKGAARPREAVEPTPVPEAERPPAQVIPF